MSRHEVSLDLCTWLTMGTRASKSAVLESPASSQPCVILMAIGDDNGLLTVTAIIGTRTSVYRSVI